MSNEQIKSLEEQIEDLRAELKVKIAEVVGIKSQSLLKSVLAQYGIQGSVALLAWSFYPEGDDEGGTVWYPEGIELTVDGKEVDMGAYVTQRKSRYTDILYDYGLGEDIDEFIHGLSSQLYEADVTKLEIKIGGNN